MKPHEKEISSALKIYDLDTIIKTIQVYDEVIGNKHCFFKYKWTLSEFLKRGMNTFLDKEAKDFTRFDIEEFKKKEEEDEYFRDLKERYKDK